MMKSTLTVAAGMLACAGLMAAPAKISGTGKCGKPETQQSIDVSEGSHHMLAIAKSACIWTKPIEMGGEKAKTYTTAVASDVMGARSMDHGYVVVEMENGDQAFVRFQGTATMKDGMPQSAAGLWTYSGGTGKLKGLKGKGTYKSTATPEGIQDQIEGEYTLPPGGK
jgi:hypothetical protein